MNKAIRILALVALIALSLASCAKKDYFPLNKLARTGTEKQIKAFLADKERAEQNVNLISDKFKYPLTEAIEAGRDIAIIKLLVEAGANVIGDSDVDIPLLNAIQASACPKEIILYLASSTIEPSNRSACVNLLLAAAERRDYDIIKALIDSGLPVQYTKAWQNFIEQIYTSAPVSGALLASASLHNPPRSENEAVIQKLWRQWNSQQKESYEFLSVMTALAASEKRTPESIEEASEKISKNWDRFLNHSANLEKNSAMPSRQQYVADLFRSAYDSIKANQKNTSTVIGQLREDMTLILACYDIDLNCALDRKIFGNADTPLIFALMYDKELALLLLDNGADSAYRAFSDLLSPPYEETNTDLTLSAYTEILEAFEPLGILQVIEAFAKSLEKKDYIKAESLLIEYPDLSTTAIYTHLACISDEQPIIKYLSAKNKDALAFLLDHGFAPVYYSYFTRKDWDYYKTEIQENSIILWTIEQDRPDLLQFILDNKFEDYIEYPSLAVPQYKLVELAQEGKTEFLKLLADLGYSMTGDIEIVEEGGMGDSWASNGTLLHYAVQGGHIETVQFLLDSGAEVNALFYESSGYQGESGYEEDHIYKTAMDFCDSDDIAELLRSHGALTYSEMTESPE